MLAWLLAVSPLPDGVQTSWKTATGTVTAVWPFHRSLFVLPHEKATQHQLESHPDISQVEDVQRYVSIHDRKLTPVLRVSVPPTAFQQVYRDVRDVIRGDLFTTDLSLMQEWCFETGLFPLCQADISVTNGRLQQWTLLDSADAVEFELPPLRRSFMDIAFTDANLEKGQVKHVRFTENDETWEVGEKSEAATIEETVQTVIARDPDAIITTGGDATLFHFAQAAVKNGLGRLSLSRNGYPLSRTRRKLASMSYMTYGRVYHSYAPFYLYGGRFHFDLNNTFLWHDGGLEGVADIARMACIDVQKAARGTIGTALTAMQIKEAYRANILIPARKADVERFRSADSLLQNDRGGFIYSPTVGIHEDVIELDFQSMYPTIMVEHNISPETMSCSCCQANGQGRRVPGTLYHTCQKREGIVPRSIRTILKKRAYYKARKHIPKYNKRQKTLKWLLVTCFEPSTILPVYSNSKLKLARIGPFIDDLIENRKPLDGIAVVGVNESSKTVFNPIKKAFRLKSPSRLLQIHLETGREFTITEDHICFVLSDGNLQEKKARNINLGDFLPVMLEMPEINCQTEIDALQRLLESVSGEDLDKWRVWGPDLDLHVRANRAEIQRNMSNIHSPGAIRTWLNDGLIPLRYFPHLEVPTKEWKALKVGYGRRVGGKIHWLPASYEIDGDLGFFLGYFIGDGSARPSFLRLAVNSDDTDLVQWFDQFFEDRFGLTLHVRKEPHTRMFTLQVNSVALVRILTGVFGVARTRATGKLKLPSLILNGPIEAVFGFFGGLIASDGYVYSERNVVNISSCDYGFIQELAYLATRIGLYFTLQDHSKQDNSLYELCFSGEDTLASLLDTGYIKRIDKTKLLSKKRKIRSRTWAKDFPVMESGLLAIARKARTTRNPRLSGKVRTSREAVHTQLQRIKEKTNKLLPDDLKQLEIIEKLVNGDIGFARVTSVIQVPLKAEFVYCFEVENQYPGFVAGAGGIFSHNCFGYQGYRNARFGRIEAHEAINAWARDALLKLGELAETRGFEIIAGIVDSLWMHHPEHQATEEEAFALCKEAKKATGLPVDLEGIYKWVVFLPRRHEPEVGVLNRYYGVFRDGTLKVRGIELRRRDTSPLIKQAQKEMIEALTPANNVRQYRQRLPKLWDVFHNFRTRLENRDVDLRDLMITTILSKAPQAYVQACHQAIATRQLAKKGVRVEAGMKIAYLITNAAAPQPTARVIPKALWQDEPYDVEKYIDLLRRAAENLIPPAFQSKTKQPMVLDKFLKSSSLAA